MQCVELQRGEAPIIVFAPPPASSDHAHGKRYFLKNKEDKNSRSFFDRKGHPKCLSHTECIVNSQQYAAATTTARSASFKPRGRPKTPTSDVEECAARTTITAVKKLSSSRHRSQSKALPSGLEVPAAAPAKKRAFKFKPYIDESDSDSDEFVMESEDEPEVLEVAITRATRAQTKGTDGPPTAHKKGTAAANAAGSTATPKAPLTSRGATTNTVPITRGFTTALAKAKVATEEALPTSHRVSIKCQRAFSAEPAQSKNEDGRTSQNATKRRRSMIPTKVPNTLSMRTQIPQNHCERSRPETNHSVQVPIPAQRPSTLSTRI